MSKNNLQARFRRFSTYSLVSVYLLILAGGIVRSTGSGMGCPDWPRCFGQWIPPKDESELPSNYKEIYKAKRHQKNEKLAKYLMSLNFNGLAYQIINEETDPVNLQFNIEKTYIEYINRLAGVITGFFIFLAFIFSFSYFKERKHLVALSFFNLVLVGFQGWIGSLVVSTDLLPWMVTIHMLLTLLIIAVLIYIVFKVSGKYAFDKKVKGNSLLVLLVLGIITSLIQMVWGTQVREEIDLISKAFGHINRHLWISNLKNDFVIHRSFSWVVLLINILLIYNIYKNYGDIGFVKRLGNLLSVMILVELLAGVILAYFSIPPFFQPIHLFLAFVIFGVQFFFLLVIKFNNSQLNFDQQS